VARGSWVVIDQGEIRGKRGSVFGHVKVVRLETREEGGLWALQGEELTPVESAKRRREGERGSAL